MFKYFRRKREQSWREEIQREKTWCEKDSSTDDVNVTKRVIQGRAEYWFHIEKIFSSRELSARSNREISKYNREQTWSEREAQEWNKREEIWLKREENARKQCKQARHEWIRIERSREIGVFPKWSCFLDRVDVLIVDTEGFPGRVKEIAVIDTLGRVRLTRTRIHHEFGGWQEARKQALQLLGDATTVLAWNAVHDANVIYSPAKRSRTKVNWHDLLQDYQRFRPRASSHKLSVAAAIEGVLEKQNHQALSDCRMTLELMRIVSTQLRR